MIDIWNVLEWTAWLISAALLLWMGRDALRTGSEFSEDLLLSSEEGFDELVRDQNG